MDFDFDTDERRFIDEVRAFIQEQSLLPDAADVMAPDRDSDSMLSDTPARRRFNQEMAKRGYLGMSWPKEYGGSEKNGIYEYLLNEELARVGAPLIGKGIGIVGKTLIRHGSEKLKSEFLPKIRNAEIEFALGYSEPGAGSDLASLRLKAERSGEGWRFNGQKIWNILAKARVVSRTRRTFYVEGELMDETGLLLARASATMMLVAPREPKLGQGA